MDWQPGLTKLKRMTLLRYSDHMLHISDRRLKKSIHPLVMAFSPSLHVLTSWKTFLQATGLDEKASAAGAVDRNGASSRGMVQPAWSQELSPVTVKELSASESEVWSSA